MKKFSLKIALLDKSLHHFSAWNQNNIIFATFSNVLHYHHTVLKLICKFQFSEEKNNNLKYSTLHEAYDSYLNVDW